MSKKVIKHCYGEDVDDDNVDDEAEDCYEKRLVPIAKIMLTTMVITKMITVVIMITVMINNDKDNNMQKELLEKICRQARDAYHDDSDIEEHEDYGVFANTPMTITMMNDDQWLMMTNGSNALRLKMKMRTS